MTKYLSSCHQAPVSVRGGEGWPPSYVCGTCHQSCELYVESKEEPIKTPLDLGSDDQDKPVVLKPLDNLDQVTRKNWSVFLAGSIEMGAAEDWQDKLTKLLNHPNIDYILNPRRDDWDSTVQSNHASSVPLAADDHIRHVSEMVAVSSSVPSVGDGSVLSSELREAILQYIDGLEDAETIADDIVRIVYRLYISRTKVAEAIGEDEKIDGSSLANQVALSCNDLRAEIRERLGLDK